MGRAEVSRALAVAFFLLTLILCAQQAGLWIVWSGVSQARKQMLEMHKDQAREHEELQRQFEQLTKATRELAEQVKQLRGDARLMRMKVNSLSGRCDPEILQLVDTHWQSSLKVLTLPETRRLAWVESRCDPFATNGTCHGIMQLDPRYAAPGMRAEETRAWLTDPDANIRAGLRYLEYLSRQFPGGDKAKILTAYNWGETRVREGKITTSEFARKVLR